MTAEIYHIMNMTKPYFDKDCADGNILTSDYTFVYELEADGPVIDILNNLWNLLNLNLPTDYQARSLSVGDIIYIRDLNEAHRVEIGGFRHVKLPERFCETLKLNVNPSTNDL